MMSHRRRLPNRRDADVFTFEADGQRYRAHLGRFEDGSPAEIFFDTGKTDAALQINAETSAVLVSLLLQYGVDIDAIRHSVRGPIGRALDLIAPEPADGGANILHIHTDIATRPAEREGGAS
jgi:hypothetical protein